MWSSPSTNLQEIKQKVLQALSIDGSHLFPCKEIRFYSVSRAFEGRSYCYFLSYNDCEIHCPLSYQKINMKSDIKVHFLSQSRRRQCYYLFANIIHGAVVSCVPLNTALQQTLRNNFLLDWANFDRTDCCMKRKALVSGAREEQFYFQSYQSVAFRGKPKKTFQGANNSKP